MTEDNRAIHIEAELVKARNAWRAAQMLRETGLFDEAASSLYYAVYHLASAALLTQGIEAESHRALQALVAQHLVKPGHLPAETSRLLAQLYSLRNQADYNRHFLLDAAGATEEFERAARLAGSFDGLLRAHGIAGLLGGGSGA